eukprot:5915750-Pyramimonas_sp.AAC.1
MPRPNRRNRTSWAWCPADASPKMCSVAPKAPAPGHPLARSVVALPALQLGASCGGGTAVQLDGISPRA